MGLAHPRLEVHDIAIGLTFTGFLPLPQNPAENLNLVVVGLDFEKHPRSICFWEKLSLWGQGVDLRFSLRPEAAVISTGTKVGRLASALVSAEVVERTVSTTLMIYGAERGIRERVEIFGVKTE